MGILNRIFKKRQEDIPMPWGWSLWDTYNVDYEGFLKKGYDNPFIHSVFNEFVTDLKAVKFVVTDKDSKVATTETAKFVNKTLERPNSELSFSEMIEAIGTYLMFGGRCMVYKTEGFTNRDLYVYAPQTFILQRDKYGKLESVMLGDREIKGNELENFHIIKTFNPNDLVAGAGSGYARLKPLAIIGDMLNYLMRHNNALLKNFGNMNGIISLPLQASREDATEMKNKLNSSINYKNAGGIFVTRGEGVKFQSTSMNQKDLDWVEGMKELQRVICRVLGIPETLLIPENSSYNNLEGYKKKVYQDTIIPFAEKIAEELTYFLRSDLAEGERITVDTSSIKVLQTDIAKEIKAYQEALEGKISTNNFINFINKAYSLNIPLLDTAQGDIILTKSNLIDLKELTASGGR